MPVGRPPSQPFASYLSGESEALFRQVPDRHDQHRLRGLMGHLSHRNIRPCDAFDAELDAYIDELSRLKVKRLAQVRRDVAITWNRMSVTNPNWPRNRLTEGQPGKAF